MKTTWAKLLEPVFFIILQNRGTCRDAGAERRSLAALQRDAQGNVSDVLTRFSLNLVSRMV